MSRTRDITHGEYTWVYEKADLEQGAYSVSDPDRQKVASILPSDRSQPIEQGRNARLLTRDFGSAEWKDRGVYTVKEAMTRGNEHIHRYRAHDQAAYTLKQIEKDGLSNEDRAPIDQQGSEARDPVLRRVAERIRQTTQRRKRETERGKDRDGGRERE